MWQEALGTIFPSIVCRGWVKNIADFRVKEFLYEPLYETGRLTFAVIPTGSSRGNLASGRRVSFPGWTNRAAVRPEVYAAKVGQNQQLGTCRRTVTE